MEGLGYVGVVLDIPPSSKSAEWSFFCNRPVEATKNRGHEITNFFGGIKQRTYLQMYGHFDACRSDSALFGLVV